jgi:hypothetical protein
MPPQWNAIYVRHNHEKAASRFLTAHGVDHYLPLYSEPSVWSNRQKRVVERPVFPGYLFVCFAPEQSWKVLMAPGVVCLASETDLGAMTSAEIALLREAVACGDRPALPPRFGNACAAYESWQSDREFRALCGICERYGHPGCIVAVARVVAQ